MPDAKITLDSVTPSFSVVNLADALAFYERALGFTIAWTWGEPAHLASVCRDEAEIMLGERGKAGPPGTARAYVRMHGVDANYEQLRTAGVTVAVEIGDRPYGLRDFGVLDPSGNELDFGEVIEKE
jgi:uncharacterized glyoxalase superfamily protein PhnB